MNIQEKIIYFSVDKAFGCLTRPALEYYIFELQKNAHAILLDLNGMHDLNKTHGYLYVNAIIRKCLKEIKETNNVEIGRIFSGDELCFIINDLYSPDIIYKFKNIFKNYNIGFKFLKTEIKPFENLENITFWLDNMSATLQQNPSYSNII